MFNRDQVVDLLNRIEAGLRDVTIRYEKFFAGVEKIPPFKERDNILKLIRTLYGTPITQADLKFRFSSLSQRFNSYNQLWERQMRLLEEGKLHRGVRPARPLPAAAETPAEGGEFDSVYRDLAKAYAASAPGQTPDRDKVTALLQRQKSQLREKYGDREVAFTVVTEDGKPKIKARLKKSGE